MRAGVDRADGVATVRLTYAEARAALARHRREGALTTSELRHAVGALDREWTAYNVIEVTETLVRLAGGLAERHALRAYDAVQLASALEVRAAGVSVEFCAFDARLNRAARRERLSLFTR